MWKTSQIVVMASCFACVLAQSPAEAGDELREIVTLEVLQGGRGQNGLHQAALKVRLAEGWKTYWRVPGYGGIPPRVSWDQSVNLKGVSVSWPTPLIFGPNEERSYGYKDQMVLPLAIEKARPDDPVRLKGEIDLGVCREVCIPATLAFDVVLQDPGAINPHIAAARAESPYTRSEAQVSSVKCQTTPADAEMTRLVAVVTMPSAGAPEIVVVETQNPEFWPAQTVAKRSGKTLSINSILYHSEGQNQQIDLSELRFTVLGQNHAVDIKGCD